MVTTIFSKMLNSMKEMLWKRVDYDFAYWYQCVDYVRWYARSIGHPIGLFSGSAYNWFKTESPIKKTKWKKIVYTKNNKPSVWDIVFFDKSPTNWNYWHVAVVHSVSEKSMIVIEQNGWKWDGSWIGTDSIRSKSYTYDNVIWWFTLD